MESDSSLGPNLHIWLTISLVFKQTAVIPSVHPSVAHLSSDILNSNTVDQGWALRDWPLTGCSSQNHCHVPHPLKQVQIYPKPVRYHTVSSKAVAFPGYQVNANIKPLLGQFLPQPQKMSTVGRIPTISDPAVKHYITERKHSTMNKNKQTQNVGGLAF